MHPSWPKTLDEAVKICLLTMTPKEKQVFKAVPESDLIMSHFGWAVNMRNEFGMWQGNDGLIRSCYTDNADDASMVIVKAVWKELNRPRQNTI